MCDKLFFGKSVTLATKLAKNGEIIKVTTQSTSGDEEFERLAMNAIRITAPFSELTYLTDEDFEEASTINFSFFGEDHPKCH